MAKLCRVDNTSVNIGIWHLIMTCPQKNSACYFMGCPCHFIDNIAGHALDGLQRATGFDVEDMCVDVYYWFDKSTKHKGILQDFCTFFDSEYREAVRYVSVYWLRQCVRTFQKQISKILAGLERQCPKFLEATKKSTIPD